MNNLHLSKQAQNDLAEIKAYITEELENLDAALATVSRITKKIRVLKNQAYIGTAEPMEDDTGLKMQMVIPKEKEMQ